MASTLQSDSSRVYKAQCKNSGEIIALKCYIKQKLHPINHIQVQREIKIHSSLAHPNIINLYGSFEDDKYYFLVQEYAEGVRAPPLCCISCAAQEYINRRHAAPDVQLTACGCDRATCSTRSAAMTASCLSPLCCR